MKKLLWLAIAINFIAALGPELGFDALWYHLTIPKIYLMWGKIAYIPGGLLYYSAMPRLGEFIFLLGRANDIFAHLVSWAAGVGSAILTYKIARKYVEEKYALLAALIFYCTPLVGWLSGSAYIDLIRTFCESLALYFVLSKKNLLAGFAVGLAVSTKTLALGSIGLLFLVSGFNFMLLIPAILISAPWFLWAYQATGYPFYPIGAGILDSSHNLGGLPSLANIKEFAQYLVFIPVGLLAKTKLPKPLLIYVLGSFVIWLVTPKTGEGRFLLPYLPGWAALSVIIIKEKKVLIIIALLFAIFSIGYRAVANTRLIPYLLGQETRTHYLCRRLDFSTRVFVDCDGWYAKNIKLTDLVLIKGFHNLYYVDFPFVHESWYKGEKVDYVLEYKKWRKN